MSWVDELGMALASSSKLDAGLRELLGSFLAANRPLLESMGPSVGEAFFRTLADCGAPAAWELLARNLSQEHVLSLLKTTRDEMAQAALGQVAQREAAQRFTDGLADVALTLLVRALVAAL